MTGRPVTPTNERFWKHVQTSDDCWIWIGSRCRGGYGQFSVRLASGKHKGIMAHVYAYELLIGPVPFGKVLDHIECDNPPCVNPGHTMPVTTKQNVLRGRSFSAENARRTHCVNGHEFTPENTYTGATRHRRACRICKNEVNARRRKKATEEKP